MWKLNCQSWTKLKKNSIDIVNGFRRHFMMCLSVMTGKIGKDLTHKKSHMKRRKHLHSRANFLYTFTHTNRKIGDIEAFEACLIQICRFCVAFRLSGTDCYVESVPKQKIRNTFWVVRLVQRLPESGEFGTKENLRQLKDSLTKRPLHRTQVCSFMVFTMPKPIFTEMTNKVLTKRLRV